MSISSVSQSNLLASQRASASASADSVASGASTATQKAASASAGPSGSAALFQQLASSLQALLLQVQGSQGQGALGAANGSAASAGATRPDAAINVSADPNAASGSNAVTGTGQAEPQHHHHHHSGGQETGAPSQMQQDASNLLNDLNGTTGTATSVASSATTASAADPTNGISASYFGAYRAYASAITQSPLPTDLGSV